MKTSEAARYLANAFNAVKKGNLSPSSAQILDTYLDQVQTSLESASAKDEELRVEIFRATHEATLTAVKIAEERRTEFEREAFLVVIENGRNALKTSLLINGGAAVALLAMMGQLLGRTPMPAFAPELSWPLGCFASGVFLVAVDHGLLYLVQKAYRHKQDTQGDRLNFVTNCIAALTYFLFAAGCVWAGSIFLFLTKG